MYCFATSSFIFIIFYLTINLEGLFVSVSISLSQYFICNLQFHELNK